MSLQIRSKSDLKYCWLCRLGQNRLELPMYYSNLLLWTLKNKNTSIIRAVVFGPKGVQNRQVSLYYNQIHLIRIQLIGISGSDQNFSHCMTGR